MRKKHITWQWLSAAIISLLMFSALAFAGNLNPSAPPAPTMKTLDQSPAKDEVIPPWSQTLPGSERFKLVLGDAAVLDKETGLVWDRDPKSFQNPNATWYNAHAFCTNKIIGNRMGWRLPTIQELFSLVYPGPISPNPALPPGWDNFFIAPSPYGYWSSTTSSTDASKALGMGFYIIMPPPVVSSWFKVWGGEAWCVRGGQGVDAQ